MRTTKKVAFVLSGIFGKRARRQLKQWTRGANIQQTVSDLIDRLNQEPGRTSAVDLLLLLDTWPTLTAKITAAILSRVRPDVLSENEHDNAHIPTLRAYLMKHALPSFVEKMQPFYLRKINEEKCGNCAKQLTDLIEKRHVAERAAYAAHLIGHLDGRALIDDRQSQLYRLNRYLEALAPDAFASKTMPYYVHMFNKVGDVGYNGLLELLQISLKIAPAMFEALPLNKKAAAPELMRQIRTAMRAERAFKMPAGTRPQKTRFAREQSSEAGLG